MQTETHRLGETIPLVVTLRQTDGTPYDLSDCRVWVSIATGATCLIVNGTVPDPLLGAVVFDLSAVDLTPRVRRASVHIEWSDGTTEAAGEFALNTVGGC